MDIGLADQERGLFVCVSGFALTRERWRGASLGVHVSASPQDEADVPREHCSHSVSLNGGILFPPFSGERDSVTSMGPRDSLPPVSYLARQEIAVAICTHSHLPCDKEPVPRCGFTAALGVSGCSVWPVHIIRSPKATLSGSVALLLVNQIELFT